HTRFSRDWSSDVCSSDLRQRLSAEDVEIFADVHVKHARSLSSDDVGLAIEEVALRAGASAVIVTGATTGRAVDPNALKLAHKARSEERRVGKECRSRW